MKLSNASQKDLKKLLNLPGNQKIIANCIALSMVEANPRHAEYEKMAGGFTKLAEKADVSIFFP